MIVEHLGDGTQTALETIVLSNIRSAKHISEITPVTKMNQKVTKIILKSLIKKGLVVKLTDDYYRSLKRGVDFGGYRK